MATVSLEKINDIRAKISSDMSTDEYQKAAMKNESKNANKKKGPLQPLIDMVPSNLIQALGNGKLMLQVIFFALFFGIAMILLPKEKTESVNVFFQNMNDIFVKMVHIIMDYAPFFVFCLMAGILAKSADTLDELVDIFVALSYYTLLVFSGLMLMLFGFYPLLLRFFGVRIKYSTFFRGLSPAQFLAFSTSSSANDNLKIPEKVTDFVLPIGATVNMDGTSLYQAIAVIFLAQYHDVDLTLLQQLGIVATATMASIGAAAVPSAGLIMLMIVLDSIGLNPLWIAIVLPVDRVLDMCRTVVNVTSDVTVSAIIAKSENIK
jgi:Na+/H+-dicarboxylate symporter